MKYLKERKLNRFNLCFYLGDKKGLCLLIPIGKEDKYTLRHYGRFAKNK